MTRHSATGGRNYCRIKMNVNIDRVNRHVWKITRIVVVERQGPALQTARCRSSRLNGDRQDCQALYAAMH
jgi:hypothetical protein